MKQAIHFTWAALFILLAACTLPDASPPGEDLPLPARKAFQPPSFDGDRRRGNSHCDKWSLWTQGTKLRGANTWQRIVVPELDGPEFLGSGYIGPPYTQADFDELGALGANYVNLSHPAYTPSVRLTCWTSRYRQTLIK